MRDDEISNLTNLLKLADSGCVPPLIFVNGSVGTGKSYLIQQAFDSVNYGEEKYNFGSIRCNELYSSKLVYEAIIDALKSACNDEDDYKLLADNPTSMFSVAGQIMEKRGDFPVFIILEMADVLFSNLNDVAVILCRHSKYLQGRKLCLILESREPLFSINYPATCPRPIVINVPEYTKNELESILLKEKPEDASTTLFHNYLQVVLGYFYLSTHDLRVLKHVTMQYFEEYSKPVKEGQVPETSVLLLWRRFEPTFRLARESLFLKTDPSKKNTTLELPYFSKFLLISAYLASYNQPKTDKRFFLKNAGKIRKRKKPERGPDIKQKMIGPLTFSIDRLMAIFESITESTDRGSQLLSQLKTLIKLKLIHSMSSESQILQPKMKCNCSEEFIKKIAATVRFDIDQYLFDNV